MKLLASALLGLSVLAFPVAGSAVELLSCIHIKDSGKAHPVADATNRVDLAISGSTMLVRMNIEAADKAMTFRHCAALADDGSSFYRWFGSQCDDLAALDGSPYTVEAYFAGAYAGVSRTLTPEDSMWKAVQKASQRAGVPVPVRTFIVYVDRKPVMDFFCSPSDKLGTPPQQPDAFDAGVQKLLDKAKE